MYQYQDNYYIRGIAHSEQTTAHTHTFATSNQPNLRVSRLWEDAEARRDTGTTCKQQSAQTELCNESPAHMLNIGRHSDKISAV